MLVDLAVFFFFWFYVKSREREREKKQGPVRSEAIAKNLARNPHKVPTGPRLYAVHPGHSVFLKAQ